MGQGSVLIGEPIQWTETLLTVDENEPFFFDHPLDHVPGSLQLFGLLDSVRAVADPQLGFERGTRLRLSVKFPLFCELNGAVRLGCSEITTSQSTAWKIRAEQNGSAVCTGELDLTSEPSTAGPASAPGEHSTPGQITENGTTVSIAAHRVNRLNPANVMIGNPHTNGDGSPQVPVVSPGPDHFLRRSGHSGRSPEELIEAARQFSVLLENVAFYGKGEIQKILYSISADFLCGIPRVPLALRMTKMARRGRRAAYDFDLIVPQCREIMGVFQVTGWSVSKAAYDRMRWMR
jgi:hypothetical protein